MEKKQGNTPAEKDTRKAVEQMQRAVDRTVEAEKNNGHFGNEQGKREATEILRRAAEEDTANKSQ